MCFFLPRLRLSGLSPFAGEDDMETLNNVRKCDWDFDNDSFKGISERAKDFIKKLLVKAPAYVQYSRNSYWDCGVSFEQSSFWLVLERKPESESKPSNGSYFKNRFLNTVRQKTLKSENTSSINAALKR